MYTALYRSHRPEVFDEILGQEHVVKILKNQVASRVCESRISLLRYQRNR